MSVRSRSNWNLEVLVFKERGKPEYPEKNLSEKGREPTTTSTHIWRRRQDLNQGHISGRRELSALCHPCTLKSSWYSTGWKVVLKDPFKKAWRAKAPSPTSLNWFPAKERKTNETSWPCERNEIQHMVRFCLCPVFRLLVFVFFFHPVKTNRTTACKNQFSLKRYMTDCLLSGTLD